MTSSGLTHACGKDGTARLFCSTVLRLFPRHRLPLTRAHPPTYGAAPREDAAGSVQGASSVFSGLNFGTIDFEWGAPPEGEGLADGAAGGAEAAVGAGAVHVRVHDVSGAVVMEQRLPLGRPAEEEARRWRGAREMASPFDAAAALRDRCALGAGAALLCVLALRRGCARGRKRVGKVECKQRHE